MRYVTFIVFLMHGFWVVDYAHSAAKSECSKCYSELANNELRIGNQFFEHAFDFNYGHLIPMSISDHATGNTFKFTHNRPSLNLPGKLNTELTKQFTSKWVENDTIVPAHYLITVRSQLDDLLIKRQCKLFEKAPALKCTLLFKGKVSEQQSVFFNNANALVKENTLIEDPHTVADSPSTLYIATLDLPNPHWQAKAIEFEVATDYNDTLVHHKELVSYRKPTELRGNLLLLTDPLSRQQLFILKSSPSTQDQLNYPGFDFIMRHNELAVVGSGVHADDIQQDKWTAAYSTTIGTAGRSQKDWLLALRSVLQTQRQWVAERDSMFLQNTWGDRSKDGRVNEAFILNELEIASSFGITHYQIDDGWQAGLSQNSASASGQKWRLWDKSDWDPHPARFPNGLQAIIDKGQHLGIEIGLWFNPSSANDYGNWQQDANILIGLHKKYGIDIFKIDGIEIPNKVAEHNLHQFFTTVLNASDNKVVFNLDVTAGRRGGYFFTNEFGNIFLENRYTDWANYYPYRTLRNLWMLSRYVPPQNLQIEFLNVWRNPQKYADDDPLAPKNVPFDYAFAITMMAQPLAWFEASQLPKQAHKYAPLFKEYTKHMKDIHSGTILPIGNQPNGMSWTGFQSLNLDEGYLLVMRENNKQSQTSLETWFTENDRVNFTPVIGEGEAFSAIAGKEGIMSFSLPSPHSFALYKYQIDKPSTL